MSRRLMIVMLSITWSLAAGTALLYAATWSRFCSGPGLVIPPTQWGFWGAPRMVPFGNCDLALSRYGIYAPDSVYERHGLPAAEAPPLHLHPWLLILLVATTLSAVIIVVKWKTRANEGRTERISG